MSAENEHQRGRIEGGFDAVIIGATVEGLAAATCLAKNGFKTVLIEAAADVGGPAATRGFAEGCKVSDEAHLVNALDRDLVREIDLYRHGLTYSERRIQTVYLSDRDEPVVLDGDLARARETLGPRVGDDAAAFEAFFKIYGDLAETLSGAFVKGLTAADGTALAKALTRLQKDVSEEGYALLKRACVASTRAALDPAFDSALLKGGLAFDAAFGGAAAPSAQYGFLNLLRRWAGESAGIHAAYAHPKGGMGALADALRRAAQSAKVDIRTNTAAKSILLEWDAAAGVALENGGQIRAETVISALDAETTYLKLIGPAALDMEAQADIARSPSNLILAKAHMALAKPPALPKLSAEALRGRFVICPSIDYLEEAFRYAKFGRVPPKLAMEFIIPTVHDETLAEGGKCVLSAWIHPAPARLHNDADTAALKGELLDKAIATLEAYAPGFRKSVLEAEIRLPEDYAAAYGMNASIWAARAPLLDQWLRTGVLQRGDRVDGLFFCGPEAVIGGGVSGGAGRRAAGLAVRRAKSRSSFL
ncbi:MAG: NAD(P)/FAD-dependent oxidoreductase [Pseudomonadota bacterium]